ncbi:LemA family protein [Aeromicrobium stalagmiti]|uniref:LemA family protein n=1 Tax=Aeromicrobium stalagmiti TaxID=2738988 RepID=UPI001568156A|nr:LemA family protein [Aeromicrobium stalagmiti]NRQ50615.1 LemA family protein [Aeromicrobium stalagmiti]
MAVLLTIIGIIVVLLLFTAYAFNKLRRLDIGAQEALGGIDVQLTRRADLIPNLVNTVKGYAQHEKGVFEAVTAARAGAKSAAADGTVAEKAEAQQVLDKAIIDVLAVAEAYPDLKASAGFLQLQTELAETEDKISFARQYYNDAVASLNSIVRTIPWLLFTGIAGVHAREFYNAPEGQETPPAVQF